MINRSKQSCIKTARNYLLCAVVAAIPSIPATCQAGDIIPSRTSGMAPLSVHFSTTAQYTNRFVWSFTEPSLGYAKEEPGNYTGMIFEKPGNYNVTLKEYSQSTGSLLATTSSMITVTPFQGTTFYLDAVSGNDTFNGTSPATAWRTPARFNAHLANLQTPQRRDITLLFKRGQTFQRNNGDMQSLIGLVFAERIRFGAYANQDGSDNPQLPRPILRDSPNAACGPTSGSSLFFANLSADILVQDLEFIGNYNFQFGDPVCTWLNPYNTGGIYTMNTVDVAVNRVLVSNLNGGIYVQKVANDIPEVHGWLVQNSEVRNTWGVHLFGQARGTAIKDSIFENNAISHITYFAPSEAGIVRNTFSGSGLRLPDNWYACVLRVNESVGNIYIADNIIKNASGSPLCFGRNNLGVAASNVMIDRNRIDGSTLPGQPHLSLFATAGLALRNSSLRNNLFINPRGPIQIGGGNTTMINNLSLEHNTIITNSEIGSRPLLHLSKYYDPSISSWTTNITGDIKFKNNILRGPTGHLVSLEYGNTALPGLDFDRNIYHRTNSAPTFEAELTLNNFQTMSLAQWRGLGRDLNSNTNDPQFESFDPSSFKFLRLLPGSPAIDFAQGTSPITDYLGRVRAGAGAADVGAYERFAAPILTVSSTNPTPSETITFTVNAGSGFAGRNVSIIASASGTTPGLVIPFSNGLAAIPLNFDQSFVNALAILTGKINSSGQYVAQTSASALLGSSSGPLVFRAAVYEAQRFVIDDLSDSVIVTPSSGGGSLSGGSLTSTPKKINNPNKKQKTKVSQKKLSKKELAKRKAARLAKKRRQSQGAQPTPPSVQPGGYCCPRESLDQDSLICRLSLFC